MPKEILMVKLNENLFHLLTPQYKLMIGNGGWSYTLNRKEPVSNKSVDFPAMMISSSLDNETARQIIFDGRTPCQNFATEHQINASQDCFKLKWRLILNRDSITYEPTTYTIRKVVDNMPRDISGKWKLIKGFGKNPEAIIYQLDPDDTEKPISLLAGDDNVLFFLNKNNELYTGNSDFSFTLNKRQ